MSCSSEALNGNGTLKAFTLVPKKRSRPAPSAFAPNEDDADTLAEEAAHDLRRSSRLLMDDPALSRRHHEQGQTLAADAAWPAALRCFDDAIGRDASNSIAHEARAQVLLELDRPFAAVQAAERAVAEAPVWGVARLTLSRAQLNLGEPVLALASAQQAQRDGADEADEDIAHIEQLLAAPARRRLDGDGARGTGDDEGQRTSAARSANRFYLDATY